MKAEFSIMAGCFNIARMISLLGTEKLVESLAAMMIPGSIADLKGTIQAEIMTITEKTVHVRQIIDFHKKSAQTQTTLAA